MKSGIKTAVSLLAAVAVFAGVLVASSFGMFSSVERTFYEPAKLKVINEKLEATAAASDAYLSNLLSLFGNPDGFTAQEGVHRLLEQSVPESALASVYMLMEKAPALDGIRIVDSAGRRVLYSYFKGDARTDGQRKNYGNYDTLKTVTGTTEIPYEYINAAPDGKMKENPVIFYDGKNQRILFSLPLAADKNFYSVVFYVNPLDLKLQLAEQRIVAVNEKLSVAAAEDGSFGGFVFGLPEIGAELIVPAIIGKWKSGSPAPEQISVIQNAEDSPGTLSRWNIITSKNGKIAHVAGIYPHDILNLPPYVRILLLICAFITACLVTLILFSMRKDDDVVIENAMKRFQFEFLRELIEKDADRTQIAAMLQAQKGNLSEKIKKALGRRGKKNGEKLDAMLEHSWEEIISVFSGGARQNTNMKELRALLEELLSSTASGPHMQQAQTQETGAEQVQLPDAPDEVEELEEIGAEDALPLADADDVTDLEPLEAAEELEPVDAEVVEELEEIEADDEISTAGADDVVGLESAEDAVAEEVESADVESVEALEEVGAGDALPLADADDITDLEPLKAAEELEPLDAEPEEALEEIEVGGGLSSGDADNVKGLDPGADVVESIEPIAAEPAEALEEIGAEEALLTADADNVEDLGPVEGTEEVEPVAAESVEELEEIGVGDGLSAVDVDGAEGLETADSAEEVAPVAAEPVEALEEIEAEDALSTADVDVDAVEPIAAEAVETLQEIETEDALSTANVDDVGDLDAAVDGTAEEVENDAAAAMPDGENVSVLSAAIDSEIQTAASDELSLSSNMGVSAAHVGDETESIENTALSGRGLDTVADESRDEEDAVVSAKSARAGDETEAAEAGENTALSDRRLDTVAVELPNEEDAITSAKFARTDDKLTMRGAPAAVDSETQTAMLDDPSIYAAVAAGTTVPSAHEGDETKSAEAVGDTAFSDRGENVSAADSRDDKSQDNIEEIEADTAPAMPDGENASVLLDEPLYSVDMGAASAYAGNKTESIESDEPKSEEDTALSDKELNTVAVESSDGGDASASANSTQAGHETDSAEAGENTVLSVEATDSSVADLRDDKSQNNIEEIETDTAAAMRDGENASALSAALDSEPQTAMPDEPPHSATVAASTTVPSAHAHAGDETEPAEDTALSDRRLDVVADESPDGEDTSAPANSAHAGDETDSADAVEDTALSDRRLDAVADESPDEEDASASAKSAHSDTGDETVSAVASAKSAHAGDKTEPVGDTALSDRGENESAADLRDDKSQNNIEEIKTDAVAAMDEPSHSAAVAASTTVPSAHSDAGDEAESTEAGENIALFINGTNVPAADLQDDKSKNNIEETGTDTASALSAALDSEPQTAVPEEPQHYSATVTVGTTVPSTYAGDETDSADAVEDTALSDRRLDAVAVESSDEEGASVSAKPTHAGDETEPAEDTALSDRGENATAADLRDDKSQNNIEETKIDAAAAMTDGENASILSAAVDSEVQTAASDELSHSAGTDMSAIHAGDETEPAEDTVLSVEGTDSSAANLQNDKSQNNIEEIETDAASAMTDGENASILSAALESEVQAAASDELLHSVAVATGTTVPSARADDEAASAAAGAGRGTGDEAELESVEDLLPEEDAATGAAEAETHGTASRKAVDRAEFQEALEFGEPKTESAGGTEVADDFLVIAPLEFIVEKDFENHMKPQDASGAADSEALEDIAVLEPVDGGAAHSPFSFTHFAEEHGILSLIEAAAIVQGADGVFRISESIPQGSVAVDDDFLRLVNDVLKNRVM